MVVLEISAATLSSDVRLRSLSIECQSAINHKDRGRYVREKEEAGPGGK